MATSATRPPRRRQRVACVVLALGAAIGIAGASYALIVPAPGPRAAVASTPARVLTIRALPASMTVTRGAPAVYRVRIGGYGRIVRPAADGRKRQPLRIWLSVRKPLPRGATARFGLRATRSSRSTLRIRTTPSTRPGRYRLRLRARGHLGPPGHRHMRLAWATVTLVVVAPRPPAFTIAGTLTEQLAPGRIVPVDLRLTNVRPTAIRITRLVVSIAAVDAPRADASHPCAIGDFAVAQLVGSYRLRLGARRARNLSAFGVPRARWPRVAMVNRAVNQDGCKHASLRLRFAGTAVRG